MNNQYRHELEDLLTGECGISFHRVARMLDNYHDEVVNSIIDQMDVEALVSFSHPRFGTDNLLGFMEMQLLSEQ